MQATRKQWSWPQGMAFSVYQRITKWFNHYDDGQIHKSKRIPSERFGLEIPDTKVLLRVHTISFRYNEVKWLKDMLVLEDPNTSQSKVFEILTKKFEDQQDAGRTAPGAELPFQVALTKDEVGYIKILLDCLFYKKPTPSERKLAGEDIASGNW